jgi:hypothetical protein
MPKVTNSIGTGMTERAVVEFDQCNPEDVDAQVNAAIRAFEMSSFDRISRRLTEQAVEILKAAELPSDPTLMYVLRYREDAPLIEPATQKDTDDPTGLLALDQAIITAGFETDSAEGYAGRILTRLHLSQQSLQDGDFDGALAFAFEVGTLINEASMKAVFEPDFVVAQKVRAGGRKAHQNTYGSSDELNAKHAAYAAAFDDARANGMDKMTSYSHAARKFKVNVRTIQRAVQTRSK